MGASTRDICHVENFMGTLINCGVECLNYDIIKQRWRVVLGDFHVLL
jgi:hypothetical protein